MTRYSANQHAKNSYKTAVFYDGSNVWTTLPYEEVVNRVKESDYWLDLDDMLIRLEHVSAIEKLSD